MAKYDVECEKCQSTCTVQLFGPGRSREWKLKYYTWVCEDCKEKEKAEAAAKAATEAESIGLPELEGTEKQVRWAEVLRVDMIQRIEEAQKDVRPEKLEEFKTVTTAIKGQTSASFWIDHRNQPVEYIVKEFIRKNPDVLKPAVEKDLEAEAALEATVRPEKVVSETVAEIRPYANRVEIDFPEKRDDFWQLVKKELGYRWSGRCWTRTMSVKSGFFYDRAAEAGHRILAAGFPIRIYDEQIREKAVAGDFEPECKKWVVRLAEGRYKDWFGIWWARSAGDFYREAKRLPASRYDKNTYSVVVPAEHFEEVMDFAEIHGFKLSPGARELAEKARTARDAMPTTSIEEKPKPDEKKGPANKPVLEMPEKVEVPDDLKD